MVKLIATISRKEVISYDDDDDKDDDDDDEDDDTFSIWNLSSAFSV
jgi:hypothetical protein